MLINYVEFLFTDGTTTVQKTIERNIESVQIPEGAIAFRFFSRVEVDVEMEGEEKIYKGCRRNVSEYTKVN